jgi:hypothetical protein
MQYAIVKEIDGQKIVTGVGQRRIDRVATMKKISNVLASKQHDLRQAAMKLAGDFEVKKKENPEADPAALNKALIELRRQYTEFEKQEILKQAVHFRGGKGSEDIYDSKLLQKLSAALKDKSLKEAVTIDGDIVPDLRGTKFWIQNGKKWVKGEVEKLGEDVPEGAVLHTDVTHELYQEIQKQEVAATIDAMTADDKKAAIESGTESLLNQAALMKSKLEIQDDPEALSKAKDWYKDQLAALKSKYK